MTPETLEALKASIAKWEKNARVRKFENATIGPRNCALCVLFYWDKTCIGCPVRERTGLTLCEGSPYEAVEYEFLFWGIDPESPARAKEFRAAASKEVDFLKSLLPEDAS